MFVLHDELKSLTFGESADSRCRMQGLQQIADMIDILEFKSEVASQVHQISRSHRARTFLPEITRKLFQALSNIGGNDALFLDILRTPGDVNHPCPSFTRAY